MEKMPPRYLKVTCCIDCSFADDDYGNVCGLKTDELKMPNNISGGFPEWCPLLTLEQINKE